MAIFTIKTLFPLQGRTPPLRFHYCLTYRHRKKGAHIGHPLNLNMLMISQPRSLRRQVRYHHGGFLTYIVLCNHHCDPSSLDRFRQIIYLKR